MSTLTLELNDSLATRLQSASAERHIAPEQFVRETIERALPEVSEPDENGPTLRELMGDAIGCVDSGIGDLATNPIHLEGFGQWRR